MAGILKCQNCGQLGDDFTLEKLNEETGEAVVKCLKCGAEQTIQATPKHCFSCGAFYWEILWCLPSGCHRCNRTFVD